MKADTRKFVVAKTMPPAGGGGGGKFDSGCNFSGVKKVVITCGSFSGRQSIIKRIHLVFEDGCDSNEAALFHGYSIAWGKSRSLQFQVPTGDAIIKASVWADQHYTNAVQFTTASGVVSAVFGIPERNSEVSDYSGERLVGLYGRYGGIIDSLGFRFAFEDDLEDLTIDHFYLDDEVIDRVQKLLITSPPTPANNRSAF